MINKLLILGGFVEGKKNNENSDLKNDEKY